MRTCRALAFSALFYGWTALLGVTALPLLVGPRRWVQAYRNAWVFGSLAILRATVGITYQVRGTALLPDGPAIFAVKHQSAWDTVAVNFLVSNPSVVLKRELLHIPIFGWCLRRLGHIAVDRAGGASALRRMVAQARQRVAEGRPVVIFPEGTRTAPGTRRPYHPGVAALYGALGLPVVPVALNSGLFWPRRSLNLRAGTITVEFLPAIAPGLDRRHFMRALEASIETAAERLHDEAIRQLDLRQS